MKEKLSLGPWATPGVRFLALLAQQVTSRDYRADHKEGGSRPEEGCCLQLCEPKLCLPSQWLRCYSTHPRDL